jgi:hypothetical protein
MYIIANSPNIYLRQPSVEQWGQKTYAGRKQTRQNKGQVIEAEWRPINEVITYQRPSNANRAEQPSQGPDSNKSTTRLRALASYEQSCNQLRFQQGHLVSIKV